MWQLLRLRQALPSGESGGGHRQRGDRGRKELSGRDVDLGGGVAIPASALPREEGSS